MMNKLLILATMFVMSSAYAGEYLYQAPAGVTAVGAQAGYRRVQNYSANEESGDPSSGDGMYRTGLAVDHGINERIAVGAAVTYTDLALKSGTTSHFKGVEPLQIYLRGQETLPQAAVLYGVDLRIGLEQARNNVDGRGGNRTLGDPTDGYSQKLTLTPYLGAASTFGANRVGAAISYDIYKADTDFKYQGSNVSVSLKRGNRSILSGFYEHKFDRVLIGADLGWIKQWELKLSGPIGSAALAGYGMMRAEVYANVAITPTAAFIPTITSISTVLSDVSDDTDDLRVTLAYRQTF